MMEQKKAGNCKIGIEYAINKRFSYMLVERTNIPYQSKKRFYIKNSSLHGRIASS